MSDFSRDVIVVGAGAAGLFAAHAAARRGRKVIVLEKNSKLGVKILMSGGTRCNITHDCGPKQIVARFAHASKFLEYPVGRLPPQEIVAIMNHCGVATKREETGKIFPVSNSAVDVRDALVDRAREAGVEFAPRVTVRNICKVGEHGFEVLTDDAKWNCDSVILTTGGKSYPGCGTTGDGYAWAKSLGHTIVEPRPALTPLVVSPDWVRELSGVTIEKCAAQAISQNGECRGELPTSLLFTHFGFSGPLAMNLSRWFTLASEQRAVNLKVDFLPEIKTEFLANLWHEQLKKTPKQQVSGLVCDPLPRRLFEALFAKAGLSSETRMGEFGKKSVQKLVTAVKNCIIPVAGSRGYEKAEVTAGGISLSEVDNRTMASKICRGLYLAGEILDIDGPIGGFNFQAAFSTGDLAGSLA